MANDSAPFEVLLVEDNPGDVRLTQEAFRTVNSSISLHVASDGVDAMAFLRREDKFSDAPRPDLILLDLHLPRVDGREVLLRVKRDHSLKSIPIVILTNSMRDDDLHRTYELHANSFINKSPEWDEFLRLMRVTIDFWLKANRTPSRHAPLLQTTNGSNPGI